MGWPTSFGGRPSSRRPSFILSVLIFSLVHLAPGNPLAFMLGVEATPEIITATEERYKLDRPLYEQYWSWLSRSGCAPPSCSSSGARRATSRSS